MAELLKCPGEVTQVLKAHGARGVENGTICGVQQRDGLINPVFVNVVNGDDTKQSAKMAAKVAYVFGNPVCPEVLFGR